MDVQRRRYLEAALAAAAGSSMARAQADDGKLETTRLRLGKVRSICLAPQYVAEALLRAEGFTDIDYVAGTSGGTRNLSEGQTDLGMNFAAPLVSAVDQGVPIVILGGVHTGCFELFGGPSVHSVRDLKGKTVSILNPGSSQHLFLASILASVGVDPQRDVRWVDLPPATAIQQFAQGKIDGYLGFPPDPQDLRARGVGRVLLNSAIDKPWSQYFCCLVAANREFARRHPVATQRALRAILKAADLCASDPEIGVKAFLALGYDTNPEYTRQAIRELPFRSWREFNPEETVRFYALRLREAGMVKASPSKLIAQGTDWRMLERVKKELKT